MHNLIIMGVIISKSNGLAAILKRLPQSAWRGVALGYRSFAMTGIIPGFFTPKYLYFPI